jgi:alpha-amylase/alpha-mannosidase (GH57 family)
MTGAPLPLAIIWHQHQPEYRDLSRGSPRGALTAPWVRLHALRDYYGMAALLLSHPEVHLTINLSPVLVEQLQAYEAGATDGALDLTLTPAEQLDASQCERLEADFFDANWHTQIYPHPRYAELLRQRLKGGLSTASERRDLQMWASLAWFSVDMRRSPVTLVTGEVVDIARFVRQGRDFDHADLEAMVQEQLKVVRAVLPAHRLLLERGQVEISASPYAHPILPLLFDTDRATIDREGTSRPTRFSRPEDVDTQIALGLDVIEQALGVRPRGMWPSEGAVSAEVVARIEGAGLQWVATDEGVLRQSGRWGYETERVAVRARAYQLATTARGCALFFRDRELSDLIGFRYHELAAEDAVADLFDRLRARASALGEADDHARRDGVVTVILDGENAWGDYADDGRPLLGALYSALAAASDVVTITPSEFLRGGRTARRASDRGPLRSDVHELATASWIDEAGSRSGNDLGTWIGEPDENLAWEYLGLVRDDLDVALRGIAPDAPAWRALLAAEGSDWFWWLGDDQDSGRDDFFDGLFFSHLRSAYRLAGRDVPTWLPARLAARARTWTFTRPLRAITAGESLRIVVPCPGVIHWALEPFTRGEQAVREASAPTRPEGRYHMVLGPFRRDARVLTFRFACRHPRCDGRGPCCDGAEWSVAIEAEQSGP